MLNAARQGDSKAALEILKHTHGWVAKQAVSIEVDQRISVIDALRAAETRVDEGKVIDVTPQSEKLTHAKTNIQSRGRATADDAVVVPRD